MKNKKLLPVFLGVLGLVVAGVLVPSSAANAQEQEIFTAFAINMGGAISSGTVKIVIDRWSTPDERNELIAAFKAGGQDELLKALQKLPKVGYISLPRTLGYDLHYAYQWPAEDGGRTIVIATDRRIAPGEVWNQTRTMDYPFELIQMKLNAEGKGKGTLAFSTRIYVSKDGSHIELENYGTQPVMLNEITAKTKKPKEPK
jgi:hypothetical protein